MMHRFVSGAAVAAALLLLPALGHAQGLVRPDRPPIGALVVGPIDNSATAGFMLEYVSTMTFQNLAGVSCVSTTVPGTFFTAATYRPDSLQHGAKSAKGSQKSNLWVNATLTNGMGGTLFTSAAEVLVPKCSLKWQVKDDDGDGDYDGGTDAMKASLKCDDSLPATLGLSAEQATAFLAAFDGKLSCSISGVPVNLPYTSCFRGDTTVATDKGLRPIRDLKVGDLVWSRDEKTGRDVLAPVEKTFTHHGHGLRDVVAGQEVLHTTDEHPFRVEGKGWVIARQLAPGDRLATKNGPGLVVASNTPVDGAKFYAGYAAPSTPKTAKAHDMGLRPASLRGAMELPSLDTPSSPTVYNIEVGTHHNYYVGESRILVHNK